MELPPTLDVAYDAPVPTWFRVGGGADRLARPANDAELMACLRADPDLRVLGDGANLLVHDDGVRELVIELKSPHWSRIEIDERTGRVIAGAGAMLPRLLKATTQAGLAGLEGLGGIPATVGGAAIMNAGGTYGQIGDAITRVHAIDRTGTPRVLERAEIPFAYRHSGLQGLVVTSVEFLLTPSDPAPLIERHKGIMAAKAASQPLAADSAGCVFKNPTLRMPLEGIADAGTRVSAGMLIDRAGCKGLSVGGATVSERHANFVVTSRGCHAADILALMDTVAARVLDRFGVTLEPEIVVWRPAP